MSPTVLYLNSGIDPAEIGDADRYPLTLILA